MADILSQEEINALLGVIDDDNKQQHENKMDKVYLFFNYLKESGIITNDIINPKVEFNYVEFRDLFTKANEVIERKGYIDQIAFLKDTIKTELSESVKALSGTTLEIKDDAFIKKSDDELLHLTLDNNPIKLEVYAEKELLQKITNEYLGDFDSSTFTSISDLHDICNEMFKPVLHKLKNSYLEKSVENLQYRFLMGGYQIYILLSCKDEKANRDGTCFI